MGRSDGVWAECEQHRWFLYSVYPYNERLNFPQPEPHSKAFLLIFLAHLGDGAKCLCFLISRSAYTRSVGLHLSDLFMTSYAFCPFDDCTLKCLETKAKLLGARSSSWPLPVCPKRCTTTIFEGGIYIMSSVFLTCILIDWSQVCMNSTCDQFYNHFRIRCTRRYLSTSRSRAEVDVTTRFKMTHAILSRYRQAAVRIDDGNFTPELRKLDGGRIERSELKMKNTTSLISNWVRIEKSTSRPHFPLHPSTLI